MVSSTSRNEVDNIIRECIRNVSGLLKSANLLIKDDITKKYGLGLYMYAVEEYGKAHLLSSFLKNNDETKLYSKPAAIFGNSNAHLNKIKEGFDNLPKDCQILSPVLKLEVNSSPHPQSYTLSDGQKLSVPPFTTGIFEESSVAKRFIEFKYKTECFYVDWEVLEGNTCCNFPIDTTRIELNIKMFRDKIESDISMKNLFS